MTVLMFGGAVYVVGLGLVITLLGTREIRAERAFHRQLSRAGMCTHCDAAKARRSRTTA